ncbi:MAG: hypothetical protein JWQ98_1179 [Chlorobi bacterium]|jgi:hypothetical protein|nr:hypothetical protein [Chlorobiota bacterium]
MNIPVSHLGTLPMHSYLSFAALLLMTLFLAACGSSSDPGTPIQPPGIGSRYLLQYDVFDSTGTAPSESTDYAMTVVAQKAPYHGRNGVTIFEIPGIFGADSVGYFYDPNGDFEIPWSYFYAGNGHEFYTGIVWTPLSISAKPATTGVYAIDTAFGAGANATRYTLTRTVSYLRPDNLTVGTEVVPVEVFVVRTARAFTANTTSFTLQLDTICYAPKLKFPAQISTSVSDDIGGIARQRTTLTEYILK